MALWLALCASMVASFVRGKVVGSCGPTSPSTVEDCQNVDKGGCGGACCNLVAYVEHDITTAMQILNGSLADGGPDGAYQLFPMFEGTIGFGDVRPYGGGWIGRIDHTTSGGYVDLVNFHITKRGSGAQIAGFSVSKIAGAFGDNGQNYKNIVMALKGAFGGNVKFEETLDGTCPSPSKDHEIIIEAEVSTKANGMVQDPQGSCGFHIPPEVSPVKDCQNIDHGSCAGACCGLTLTVQYSKEMAMSMLNESLAGGGPDGNYTLQVTAEGPLGFADLSQFDPSLGFLGQVHHTTIGGFVDKINFYVNKKGTKGKRSVINAFSVSTPPGSYLDLGQNYKNIVNALESAFPDGLSEGHHKFGSCPPPSSMVV